MYEPVPWSRAKWYSWLMIHCVMLQDLFHYLWK